MIWLWLPSSLVLHLVVLHGLCCLLPPSPSRAALISIHQQLMEGQTDSFLPGPVSSSWSSLTHLPLLYLPPYRQLLSSLVSRHCPLACTTSACVRVWLWAARVGVMSANAHPPYPRCSMSEHVLGSGSWTWCGRCHPGIYAFSEGTLGRRHSAVLKSKVTLPSHLLCHLLYGAEMLGVQRQKETGFALEELPDRQWRQTHRLKAVGAVG